MAGGLLGRLLGPRTDPELAALTAWAVDQVEPRLKQVGGFPQRYATAIAHASAYCSDLASRVPGPIELNRQAFAQTPLVHALFGASDGIAQALVKSKAVREWQRNAGGQADTYALMGVRRWTKDIFGMEDSNGMLRRDVAQKAVYFADHTFSNLGTSLEDTRSQLARQFLSSLLARVKDRLDALGTDRHALEQESDELRARLRASPHDTGLQAALEKNLAALRGAVAGLDLRSYARDFDAVLGAPEQYLGLRSLSMTLDAMGIQQPAGGEAALQPLDFTEMACRDRRRWIVMVVRCRLDELPPYHERLAQEERWLAI